VTVSSSGAARSSAASVTSGWTCTRAGLAVKVTIRMLVLSIKRRGRGSTILATNEKRAVKFAANQ
jgi:hypothetical protein